MPRLKLPPPPENPVLASIQALSRGLFGPAGPVFPVGMAAGPSKAGIALMDKMLGRLMKRAGKIIRISSYDPQNNRVVVHELTAPQNRWATSIDEMVDSMRKGKTVEWDPRDVPQGVYDKYLNETAGTGKPVTNVRPRASTVPRAGRGELKPPPNEQVGPSIREMLEASLKERSGKVPKK